MTAFRTTAARPAAFLLALAVTASMLAGVNALGTHEYRQALVAQAATAPAATASAANA